MTMLRVFADGRRCCPDIELPPELESVDLEATHLLITLRRGKKIVSFSAKPEIVGELVVFDHTPDDVPQE